MKIMRHLACLGVIAAAAACSVQENAKTLGTGTVPTGTAQPEPVVPQPAVEVAKPETPAETKTAIAPAPAFDEQLADEIGAALDKQGMPGAQMAADYHTQNDKSPAPQTANGMMLADAAEPSAPDAAPDEPKILAAEKVIDFFTDGLVERQIDLGAGTKTFFAVATDGNNIPLERVVGRVLAKLDSPKWVGPVTDAFFDRFPEDFESKDMESALAVLSKGIRPDDPNAPAGARSLLGVALSEFGKNLVTRSEKKGETEVRGMDDFLKGVNLAYEPKPDAVTEAAPQTINRFAEFAADFVTEIARPDAVGGKDNSERIGMFTKEFIDFAAKKGLQDSVAGFQKQALEKLAAGSRTLADLFNEKVKISLETSLTPEQQEEVKAQLESLPDRASCPDPLILVDQKDASGNVRKVCMKETPPVTTPVVPQPEEPMPTPPTTVPALPASCAQDTHYWLVKGEAGAVSFVCMAFEKMAYDLQLSPERAAGLKASRPACAELTATSPFVARLSLLPDGSAGWDCGTPPAVPH